MRLIKCWLLITQLLLFVQIWFPFTSVAIVDMKNANYGDTWHDWPGVSTGDLGISRTYNSRSLHDGIFGFGWCSDFETRLDLTAEGNVILVHCGAGSKELYARQGFSRREVEAMADRILERARADWISRNIPLVKLLGRVGDSGWKEFRGQLIKDDKLRARVANQYGLSNTLPQKGEAFILEGRGVQRLTFDSEGYYFQGGNGESMRFDTQGRLISSTNREGRMVTLTYDDGGLRSVENKKGDRLEVEILASGKIGKVKGSNGKEVEYRYSEEGNLVSVKNFWGNFFSYEYDNYHNLTRINYPDQTFKRLTYDKDRDWVTSFRGRDGCVEEYAYDGNDEYYLSRVRKQCGAKTTNESTYEFFHALNGPGGIKWLQRLITTINGIVTDITYDEASRKPVREVRNGNVVESDYYPNGLLRIRQDATTLREYFYAQEMTIPQRVVERDLVGKGNPMRTTIFSYDEKARVIIANRSDGLGATYLRNDDGHITEVHFEDGRQLILDAYDDHSGMPALVTASGDGSHGTFRVEWDKTECRACVRAVRNIKGGEGPGYLREWLDTAMDLSESMINVWPCNANRIGNVKTAPTDVSSYYARYAEQRSAGDFLGASETLKEWDTELVRAGESKSRFTVGVLALTLGTERALDEDFVAGEALLNIAYEVYDGLRLDGIIFVLERIAEMRSRQGRHTDAVKVLQDAINRIDVKDPAKQIDLLRLLESLAKSYRWLGRYGQAYENLERAKSIAEASGERLKTAEPATAALYKDLGLYQQAMALYRNLGPTGPDDEFHFIIANLFNLMGQPQRAIEVLEPHLRIADCELDPNHPKAGELLSNLGGYYTQTGQYEKAYTALERAITIFEKAPKQQSKIGEALNEMGILQSILGQHSKALSLYDRSLALGKEAKISAVQLVPTIANRAISKMDLGQLSEAKEDFRMVIDIDRKSRNDGYWRIGNTMYWLAEAYRREGDIDSALMTLRDAATILEAALGTSNTLVARVLRAIGEIMLERGEVQQASHYLQRCLETALRSGDPEETWRAQHQVSQSMAKSGSPYVAVLFGKQAVNNIQGLRNRISGLDPTMQRSFVKERQQPYRDLVELLIDQGRLDEAEQVLTMLKEEEYYDYIRRDASNDVRKTQATHTGLEPEWKRRYEQISGQLVAQGRRRDELEQKRKLGLTSDEETELKKLRGDATVARQAFVSFLDELTREYARLDEKRIKEIARRNIEKSENYQKKLRSLKSSAVILHYVVLKDRVHIILTTPQTQLKESHKIQEEHLNRLIMDFRWALQNREDTRESGQRLYEVLIAPVVNHLEQADPKPSTLILSLDSNLRYVPFAALTDGKDYLMQKYNLALLTPAVGTEFGSARNHPERIAAFGLTRKIKGFSELKEVRKEIESIIETSTVPVRHYTDHKFTADQLYQEVSDHETLFLHLATHFVFNPGTETDSFMLLGDESRLTLRNVRESGYNFNNVELLTLSACKTAMGGGSDANGREVEGLGVLAQERGAQAVIATLWPVMDSSTAKLMTRFYKLMFTDRGINKAEALRQAQLALLRGTIKEAEKGKGVRAEEVSLTRKSDTVHKKAYVANPDAPYAHPYFWAPFILMGNWL